MLLDAAGDGQPFFAQRDRAARGGEGAHAGHAEIVERRSDRAIRQARVAAGHQRHVLALRAVLRHAAEDQPLDLGECGCAAALPHGGDQLRDEIVG
ncbi:MAG: hypothetical protein U1F11_08580 [Steroidobacteraceae bacterium]